MFNRLIFDSLEDDRGSSLKTVHLTYLEPETEYQVWVEARTKNDVPSRSEEVKVTTFTQINLPQVTEKTPRYNMKDHRSKGGFYAKFSFKITVNFLLTGKLRKKP